VTTYTFTNLTDGLTYYFIATAYNLARFESSYSNEVSKTALSISSGDTHNSMGQNSLNVTKSGTGSAVVTSSTAGNGGSISPSVNDHIAYRIVGIRR